MATALPLLEIPGTNGAGLTDPTSALAALERAGELAKLDTSDPSPGAEGAPPSSGAADQASATRGDRTQHDGLGSPSATGGERRGRGRPRGSKTRMTADRYAEQQARELRRELEQLRARNQELEARDAARATVTDAEAIQAVEELCAEGCDALANLAAAAWGPHMKLDAEQKTRLGALWARVARQKLPELCEESPTAAAVVATIGFGAAKLVEHRALLAQVQGDAKRLREGVPGVNVDA